MYAVEVVPIQRGLLKGSLSFFSKTAVPRGAVVSAPVRKRMVPALVLSCRDVREQKMDLKASDFSLKKLSSAEPRVLFRSEVMDALERSARVAIAPQGALISQLTFAPLLAAPRALHAPIELVKKTGVIPEVLVLQAERDERVQAYKNLVRESFARGKSVVVICPTLIETELLEHELSRGIEDRVVVATSLKSTRDLRRAWNQVATEEPLLIIGTPPVLTFPFRNIDAVVVERESARSYTARTRPQIDLRSAAEATATALGARLIRADFPVRAETYARLSDGTYEHLARPQARSQSKAELTILDVRALDAKKNTRRFFSSLQDVTYDAMSDTLSRHGHVVVYAARRGIAPMTVCNDCGTPIVDKATNTPMVLHKTPRGNVFMSHRSGAVESAERACAVCGGWNLVSLGIGVDRVYDEIVKHFPKAPCITFTQDSVPTHKVAVQKISEFTKTPGSIIIGTERMVPYLPHVALTVVASIDSILSLPAWRAEEHALSILHALVERTDEHVIIETRRPESRVMKSITSSPLDFLRDELKERHAFGYPPYKVFIGLTWEGTDAHCAERKNLVATLLSDIDLVGPLPPEAVSRGQYRQRAVVRVEPSEWPNDALIARLESLPVDIAITVDPDDIV